MKFTTSPISVIQPEFDYLELLNAKAEMIDAFEGLTDAQKAIQEIGEVMDNISRSVDLITKYGQAGVEELNVDGSLSALFNIPSKLITAEKAQEGFADKAKELWNKFVQWVKDMLTRLVNFFRNIMTFSKATKNNCEAMESSIKNTPEETKKENIEKKIPKRITCRNVLLLENKQSVAFPFEYNLVSSVADDLNVIIPKFTESIRLFLDNLWKVMSSELSYESVDFFDHIENADIESKYFKVKRFGLHIVVRGASELEDSIASIKDNGNDKTFEERGWSTAAVDNIIAKLRDTRQMVDTALKILVDQMGRMTSYFKKYIDSHQLSDDEETRVNNLTYDEYDENDLKNYGIQRMVGRCHSALIELSYVKSETIHFFARMCYGFVYDALKELVKIGSLDKRREKEITGIDVGDTFRDVPVEKYL